MRNLSALHRKLLRDLQRLRGQVLTIALVLGCGIASFMALRGTLVALRDAQETFYERQRFAEVFAALERAPAGVLDRIEAIPGVVRAQARIRHLASVPLRGIPEPIRAQVVGLPGEEQELLNRVAIRSGRRPMPGRDDEVVLLHGFAAAHSLEPGDRVTAVIAGNEYDLRVVGTAVSPEYVIGIAPGAMSAEPKRFAVLWLNSAAVARTLRMEGAFNDVAVDLAPGASPASVIDGVDRVLEPYGGLGAYDRSRQPSNHVVEGELSQLRGMANVLPTIFLAVSALLVSLVLGRMVRLQQPEIATLKALGYSGVEVGLHFLEFAVAVATLGAVFGLGLGSVIGGWLVDTYAFWFRFPDLAFRADVAGTVTSLAVGYLATLGGAVRAVVGVVRLPPAEAMLPPAPARYRRSWFDGIGLAQLLGPSLSMIRREIARRPLRVLGSSLAIAAATALSVVGGWYYDGIRALVDIQFHDVMREDLMVSFVKPVDERAIRALSGLPGVLAAEGLRTVPVRFRSEHRYRDGALVGYPSGGELRSVRDRYGRAVPFRSEGVILTKVLAESLGVRPGDSVTAEVREGRRRVIRLPVADLVDDAFGLQGHLSATALHSWLGESRAVSAALLRLDPARPSDVDAPLRRFPAVLTAMRKADLIRTFNEQSGGMLLTTALVITLFAGTITVGVVYNNARAALSMRARDLASLRVLGFTRGEVSSVLLGEVGIQALLAIPVGLVAGRALVALMASTTDPEAYRMPLLITPRTYAFAALVTLLAALVSALLVRRRVDQLDLVSVLKARE